ncbi:hypothetical protein [Thalassospira aquimaris]|uniref:Uncharacterized protein n=1 Tax=Thalassospira aquimaris TaxID=3037796 RepID=A0ABT6GI17_9PROT|nr:hypothetical protein [Thalassospira sp. FZY0004]MDG4721737.1 hypothetical protein [Thalassospira sp. FZY0004]
MSKPMLIEALKPGMRAKLGNGEIVWRTENCIRSKTSTKISNVHYLTTTEYEIIPDGPKPWTPSYDQCGWLVDRSYGIQEARSPYPTNLRTKQAAEHMAQVMRVQTAIMNMPGHGGDGWFVYWYYDHSVFVAAKGRSRFFSFNSEENAQAAAKLANELLDGTPCK